MEIKDAVALVSGGASGLGEATVRRWIAAGGRVVVMDRNSDRGTSLVAGLGSAAAFVQADVTDATQVQAAIDKANTMGVLRAAVNCAGIGWAQRTVGRDGAPHDFEMFKTVVGVNLFGTFNVLRLAAASMAKVEPVAGERGVIVSTASIAAFDGQIGQIAYAASKGGVVGMTLPAARDLSSIGIRVVTIAPGLFDTPLLGMLPDEARQALSKSIPFPARLGDPDEFGRLVQHIFENGYLNGEVIRLDGSLRMSPK